MSKYKWDNLILFFEQLSSATALQLPVDQTVRTMSRESLDSEWRAAQDGVAELVQLGSPLSDAMENYSAYFPSMAQRLVRAGEQGDVLPSMLSSISGYLQSVREIQQDLRRVLVYPFFVWTLLLVNFMILFTYVAPKNFEMFESMGAKLPVMTDWYYTYGPALFLLGTALVFFLAWLIVGKITSDVEGHSKANTYVARFTTAIPLLGTLQRHARTAHVCEILGVLVKGGNSMREAIGIAKEAISSPGLIGALEDVEAAIVTEDVVTSKPRKTLVPHTTLWMMSETENTERLGDGLLSLASMHRRQMNVQTRMVNDILEPFLLIVVAIFGGIGLVAMYGPLMNMASVLFQIRM